MYRSMLVALTCTISLGLVCVPAIAEKADRDKPINVSAASSTLDDLHKVTVLDGDVIVTQGTLTIHANKVIMRQLPDGTETATAFGNPVALRQKREGLDQYVEGYAQRVEYNDKSETVELFDNALLKRGADEVRNSYISYNMTTELAQAKCAPGASGCGRVRAVFQPPRKNSSAAAPAPAADSTSGTALQPSDQLKAPPSP